ncbi:MAG TPA: hypothetical protein VF691_22450 [Cytophagaceae bacterium]|jgi:DNA-binding response OmpR family regulator
MKDRLILIVDKDDISNFITKLILKQTGFLGDIVAVKNCSEAEFHANDYYQKKMITPTLILIDITLFESDCLNSLTDLMKLSGLNRKIPIVIMGNFSGVDKLKLSHSDIDFQISKPLTVEKVNQIKSALVQKYIG